MPEYSSESLAEPVESFVRLLRGRHKPNIVIQLGQAPSGALRFGELRRAVQGISERVLARQLDELERDRIVERTAFPDVPPRVEYHLTARGRTLCPILKQMWKWSVMHG